MKIVSSFSGGKTSAYMTIKLKEKYPDLIVLFANTGQERDETLDFVNRCDLEYGLNIVWIEGVTHHNKRIGNTHSVVNYYSADRSGVVFESMIKKYGIPNKAYPHCTRELKANPIRSWIKENVKSSFKMAVGIRIDEQNRVSKNPHIYNLFYPLIDWKISKIDINDFWNEQDFSLHLKEHQGNCKACFKKSKKKLLAIAFENPEYFDFTSRMELLYGLSGHNVDGNKRVFFRENKSTKDILNMASKLTREDAVGFIKSIDTDATSPCSESCEAFSGEQLIF